MERVMQNRMTHEGKIGRGFEEEREKQSNAWAVHKIYG
jgi:hypothetical protein